jgi:hypothetical protein
MVRDRDSKPTAAGKWMELETITLSERSQAQKDKCHMCLLISSI